MHSDALVYLYGIVPPDAPEPDGDLLGLDDAPVRLVRFGRVAAAVSDLPASLYADAALDQRLEDLDWVGQRGIAHERVLDWFAERGPVVPLSLFSLHRDDARLAERLEDDAPRLEALLERFRGRREWGVKLWRRDAALEPRLDELSPTLRALAAELEQAAPGRRFLLEKKRQTLRSEELRRVSARISHTVFGSLREVADRAASVPLPQAPPRSDRVLTLHAAFLVEDASFPAFQRRLGELAGEFQPFGLEFEFTGPWPPYHFVEAHGD